MHKPYPWDDNPKRTMHGVRPLQLAIVAGVAPGARRRAGMKATGLPNKLESADAASAKCNKLLATLSMLVDCLGFGDNS